MNDTKFTAVDWSRSTNIYEVNIRQYTPEGTFNAFASSLPRLRDMGIHTLWFMPITPIAQKNKKGSLGSPYACSDYTSINPEFGTLDDFNALVKQAHALGFKVIIDWVANHTGWDHVWTKQHPDYYKKDPHTGDFLMASGMDDIIELNYSNPELRHAMIEAMKFWVQECNIDGFRCDLASWVQLDFWVEARPLVDALKPLFWLGEFDELESHGYGKVFDASYSWRWMHQTKDFYQQHLPLEVLEKLLNDYNTLGDDSMRAWFTTNHDENSWNGTEYEKYGNMAKALAVFSATWNGVPLMYSGQELPLLAKRLAFFDRDPIPWTTEFAMHDFYKKLLTLKSEHPALRAGDTSAATYRLQTTDNGRAFFYLRRNVDREVLVLLNLSRDDNFHVEITDPAVYGTFRCLFTGDEANFDDNKKIEMMGYEYRVFVR